MHRTSKMAKAALAGVCALLLTACSAQYRNHGYVPSEDDLSAIVVGVDTRDSVAESVGTPSAGSLVDETGYYYVKSRVRHFAYQAPEVINREVVAITFDAAGTVENIERFGLEKGKAVPLSRRVTTSGASRSSFLRNLLKTLGRINPGAVLGG